MSVLGALLLLLVFAATTLGVRSALAWAGERRWSVVVGASLGWLAWGSELFGRVPADVGMGAALAALLALFGILLPRSAGPRPMKPDVAAVVVAAVLFALFASVALTTWLWDERSAHFGISSAMARGAVPAVHPTFPDLPFAYHIGFNTLAALVIEATGARPDIAIDVVALVLLASLLWLLMDVGQRMAGRVGACTAPLLALLGSGPAALCVEAVYQVVPSCAAALPDHWLRAAYVPPNNASNFFQHPTALGMVVAFTILLLVLDRPRGEERRAWIAGSVLVGTLAQAHIVFFALTGLGLGVVVVIEAARARDGKQLLERTLLLVGALLLALLTARFFGPTEVPARFVFSGHFAAAYRAGPAEVVAWNLIVFLPALVGALFTVMRAASRTAPALDPARVALLAMCISGFVVGNVVSYERSWDIVKFLGAAAFAGNLLFVDVIGALVPRLRVAAVVVVVVACATGLVWVLRFGALNGVIAPRYTERAPDALALEVARRFGDTVGQGRVLTRRATLQEGGIGLAAVNPREIHTGLLVDREKRTAMFEAGDRALRELDLAAMRALGASFFFVSAAEIEALSPAARERLMAIEPAGQLDVDGMRWFLVPVPVS